MDEILVTRNALISHCRKYPLLQPQDLLKFICQSAFGCEHMVSSYETALEYIAEERESFCTNEKECVEMLDGDYCRIHLSVLDEGLSVQTLAKLFYLSACKENHGIEKAEKMLDAVRLLIQEKEIGLSESGFEMAARKWRLENYAPLHHSDAFRREYSPSYRVVNKKFAALLPLLSRLDELLEKGRAVLAIDGGSASGKTTLAGMLTQIYGCTVFHMDDFFLRPEQRTAERYAQAGGNVDRERFSREVLMPLGRNEAVEYRRFDCSVMKLLPPVTVFPERLIVVEGAYSMHTSFGRYYDLSVFLDIEPQLQIKRISLRNTPETAQRFYNEWIPLEKEYFSHMNVKQRSDITVEVR